jgi:uncharacterized protein (DUF433 family)
VEDLLDRIEVDPDIMVGKPVIKGTRIPVDLIIKLLGEGLTVEEILKEYPQLSEKDIIAALLYASKVLSNEEVFPVVQGEMP